MENKAKEKADELYANYLNSYAYHTNGSADYAVKKSVDYALICVEEIINLMVVSFKWDEKTNGNIHFWEEVRDELNKMK